MSLAVIVIQSGERASRMSSEKGARSLILLILARWGLTLLGWWGAVPRDSVARDSGSEAPRSVHITQIHTYIATYKVEVLVMPPV